VARPDFGTRRIEQNGACLECRCIAPGITMSDLMTAYHEAETACTLSDSFSGDPSRWPGSRGVLAVTEMLLTAIYGEKGHADGVGHN